MDWATTMMGNTSRNIKSTIDKYAESIGECYSKLRQEVIYKYFKNHDFPHPKFLGALMCTMKEYGNLYYGKNARRPDM